MWEWARAPRYQVHLYRILKSAPGAPQHLRSVSSPLTGASSYCVIVSSKCIFVVYISLSAPGAPSIIMDQCPESLSWLSALSSLALVAQSLGIITGTRWAFIVHHHQFQMHRTVNHHQPHVHHRLLQVYPHIVLSPRDCRCHFIVWSINTSHKVHYYNF